MLGRFVLSLSLFGGLWMAETQASAGISSSPISTPEAQAIYSQRDTLLPGKVAPDDYKVTPMVVKEPAVKNPPINKENLPPLEEVEQILAEKSLPAIHFSFNSVKVESAEQSKVAQMANALKNHPKATLTIEGYTDSRGSEEVNSRVSKARAQAVKTCLVNQYGISASRISIVGKGTYKAASDAESRRAVAILK